MSNAAAAVPPTNTAAMNRSFQNFLREQQRLKEEKYKKRFFGQALRNTLKKRFGKGREATKRNITSKYNTYVAGRTAIPNYSTVKTARTTSNANRKARINKIVKWAQNATNKKKVNSWNVESYKRYRPYFIQELNKIAYGKKPEYRSLSVARRNFIRTQLTNAKNLGKKSVISYNKAARYLNNARIASAKATRLAAVNATSALNSTRARLAGVGANGTAIREQIRKEQEKIKELNRKAQEAITQGQRQQNTAIREEVAAVNAASRTQRPGVFVNAVSESPNNTRARLGEAVMTPGGQAAAARRAVEQLTGSTTITRGQTRRGGLVRRIAASGSQTNNNNNGNIFYNALREAPKSRIRRAFNFVRRR